jgi:basic membrane protein A
MRTIKGATAHAFHDAAIWELRRHIADWLAAYNVARQLKALRWRTPTEAIHTVWQQKPELLQATGHYSPGPNTQDAAWIQAPAGTAGRWTAVGGICPVPGLLRPACGTSNIACQALPRAYASHQRRPSAICQEWETMMIRRSALLAAAGLLVLSTAVRAQDFQPALIFDMGGKFDKSFNEAAYNGAEKFKAETGIDYLEFEVTNESQRDQALERMARRASIVVVVGFAFGTSLETIAERYPDAKFTIIDASVDKPNVQSVLFKEHEGSYLVGMAGALTSKTGKLGFVGGMDIPLIHNFEWGYEQGAKAAKPDIQMVANYVGTTPAAWSDSTRAKELAFSHYDSGADVVYAAAGAAGLGVLEASADRDKFSIGVDSNQNHLYPGHVLTSMLKRVDVAVYDAFKSAQDGSWKPGLRNLGLKENGVDYARDENNKDVLTPDVVARLDEAKAKIISGEIVVQDYYSKQQ